ncbi:hypothetical protein CF8_0161 [Aeromonas phage CF8]|nr:hypothetical protein CF8_0161 [Aeromonas phage CF8]
MAIEKKVFPRWIRDPLFTPIKQFLNKQLALINKEGTLTERLLAKERYQGMKPEDFVAEDIDHGSDGVNRFCLVRRNKQFARVDLNLEQVRLRDIFIDQSVSYLTINTMGDFIYQFKQGNVQGKVLYLVWRDAFGVCLDNNQLLDLQKTDELFKHIFFDELSLERVDEPTIDPDTLTSGVVRIKDRTCSDELVHVFVTENIIEQLALDRLVDNFPPTLMGRRGDTLRHALKIMIGDEDVTGRATINYSTGQQRINCSTTGNKLESVFKIIRGNKTQETMETITIDISVEFMGELFTKQTQIAVRIVSDIPSQLTLMGYPVEVTVPCGKQIGVVVKGFVNGSQINFTQMPSFLTSMVSNTTLNNFGAYRGGVLYLGTCNPVVEEGQQLLDLVKGQFTYISANVTHTASVFVDLVINPVDPNFPVLVNDRLEPSAFSGEVDTLGEFFYVNSLGGVVIPTASLDIPNGELGTRRLIRFTGTTPDKIQYMLVNGTNGAGEIETDTVVFSVRYIDQNTGLVYTRQDQITPTVITPSDIKLIPLTTANIIASKYESGKFPFRLLINGKEDYSKITDIAINDPNGFVRKTLFAERPFGEWQVLDTGDTEQTSSVEFTVSLNIDNGVRTVKGIKAFTVNAWQGGELGVIPNAVLLKGKAGDGGITRYSFFNEDQFANAAVQFISEQSAIPPQLSFNPISVRNPEFVEASYQLHTQGNYSGDLVFSLGDDTDPLEGISVGLTANIEAGEELFFVVPGITTAKPLLPGEVLCQITYKGANIPINDPRVRLDVTPVGIAQGVISIGERTAIGFNFISLIDNVPMGGNIHYELIVEMSFVDEEGKTQTRTKEAVIELKRDRFTTTSGIVLTNPIKPVVSDQAILMNLTDPDGDPLLGVVLESVIFGNQVDMLGPIQSYRNNMVERRGPATLGNYEFKITTNHFGGMGLVSLKVRVGGEIVTVIVPDIVVEPAVINVTMLNSGIAVNNIQSVINFKLFQDKLNNFNSPVIMKRIENLVFDTDYFNEVNNIQIVDNGGNYRLEVISAGMVGKGEILFDLITSENNNTKEVSWNVKLLVDMNRN